MLSTTFPRNANQADGFEAPAAPRYERAHVARRIGMAAAVCVLIAVVVLAQDHWAAFPLQSPAATPSAALSLQAKARSGGLLITWDRGSDIVRQAIGGVLSIDDDGQYRKDVWLDGGELRTERIHYSPAGTQTQFRLTVYSANHKSVHETVLTVNAPSAVPIFSKPLPTGAMAMRPHSTHRIRKYRGSHERSTDLNLPAPNTSDSGSILVPRADDGVHP